MERVFLSGRMAVNMKVNLKTIKETDMVHGRGIMETAIQATGKMENRMEKARTKIKAVMS